MDSTPNLPGNHAFDGSTLVLRSEFLERAANNLLEMRNVLYTLFFIHALRRRWNESNSTVRDTLKVSC